MSQAASPHYGREKDYFFMVGSKSIAAIRFTSDSEH